MSFGWARMLMACQGEVSSNVLHRTCQGMVGTVYSQNDLRQRACL